MIWEMRNELAMAWDIFAEQVPVLVQNVLDGASVLLASLQAAIHEASSFDAGVDSSGAVLAELVDFKLAKLVRCLDILEQRFLREIECVLLPFSLPRQEDLAFLFPPPPLSLFLSFD